MSDGYDDGGPFPEPFGPVYERPQGAPCPRCRCCTLRLCELATREDIPCSLRSHDPPLTASCPCSATAEARATCQPEGEDSDTEDH